MLTTFTINKQIKVLQNSVMQNNTVVYSNDDKVYIIDPSFDAKEVYKQYKDYKQKYVILTHSHFDHIGDVEALNNFADTIYMSSQVKEHKKELVFNIFFNTDKLDWDKVQFIEDKQGLDGISFYHTPGHSIDSMCVVIDDVIVAGDHIFPEAIGRTDLPTSNSKQMYQSILYFKQILKDKDIEIMVPGHGRYLSIEELFKINHYLLAN